MVQESGVHQLLFCKGVVDITWLTIFLPAESMEMEQDVTSRQALNST